MVAKVIRSDDEGHRKVQIAIPKVSKVVDEIVAQEYEIIEHNLGRIIDDMEYEEIQEGMVSNRERLRKANERIIKLEAQNKYWRDCQPIQQLRQAALLQDNGSNIEEISAQLREVKDWTNDIIQNGEISCLPLSRHLGHWWLLETNSEHLKGSGRISFHSRTQPFLGSEHLLGYQRDIWKELSWWMEE